MKNYFTLAELMVTNTGIENDFSHPQQLRNLEALRYTLNVVRSLVGCPITITSGFRSPKVNAAVGGVENSLHLQGRAADITCSRFSSLKSICKEFHQKGILGECVIHDNYIHVAI